MWNNPWLKVQALKDRSAAYQVVVGVTYPLADDEYGP